MDQFEQLKEIIQKANPEIMELKFGCRIKYENKLGIYIEKLEGFADCFKLDEQFRSTGMSIITNPKLESLGRPIRLADVLLALRKKATVGMATISINGFLTVNYAGDKSGSTVWNLKDDFDNQSKETKKFLIDLLVPRKP
jgi:hypothetical protein